MENKENLSIYDRSFLLVIFFLLLAFLSISILYITKLESQVTERDDLIRHLTFSDNLVKEYFDIQSDSVKGITSYILKESTRKIVNTETTIRETITETKIVQNELDDEKYGELVVKYNLLVVNFNNLSLKYSKTKDLLNINNSIIDLIKKNYQISISVDNNENQSRISVKAEKIDSALMILPYFRHKLQYDEKNKQWMIRK